MRRERSHAAAVAVLLLVSLATTGLIVWQADSAARSHRATTERVLRDYAALAGNELVRRVAAAVGYEGCYPVLTALRREASGAGLGSDTLAALRRERDARLARGLGLVRGLWIAEGQGAPRPLGSPADPEAAAWLAERLPAALAAGGEAAWSTLHGRIGGQPRSFVLAPVADGVAAGFELRLDALGGWLEAALARNPLLPAWLGDAAVSNDALAVSIRDHAGGRRLSAGGAGWPELGVEVPFGAAYGGVLDGWTVAVSIDPASGGALLVGGLPRSPLPALLGLLAVNVGLVATALLQLRRERQLHRLRAEFVSSVSHELRTPLTQLRMFAETLLLDRVRSPEERRRALEILDREARRLAHLVENVLQFSRLERGTQGLTLRPRPLAPLVRELLDDFGALAAGSGARLTARLDERASAPVDEDAMRQVLLNLLDNAIKYGPRGQEVVVELEARGDRVRLSVDDQGPGIPARDRRRIFERFQRLERDRRSAVAGTGIGLAVVRDLVERHGGRVFSESGARGGARLVAELPAARSAADPGPGLALPREQAR